MVRYGPQVIQCIWVVEYDVTPLTVFACDAVVAGRTEAVLALGAPRGAVTGRVLCLQAARASVPARSRARIELYEQDSTGRDRM